MKRTRTTKCLMCGQPKKLHSSFLWVEHLLKKRQKEMKAFNKALKS